MHIIPKKSLGQNFLKSSKFADYIAGLCVKHEAQLIEVGCGTGQLTRAILQQIPVERRLHGVEIDPRMTEYLSPLAQQYPNFTYEIGNFLDVGHELKHRFNNIAVFGNLPYNVGTKILLWCVENGVSEWTFMLQKEVVERIAAKVGNREYGSLSVLVQAFYELFIGRVVPPEAFSPAPKVRSQVISGKLSPGVNLANYSALSKILKSAFSSPRKMLKNTLCKIFQIPDIQARPQDLSPGEYLALMPFVP